MTITGQEFHSVRKLERYNWGYVPDDLTDTSDGQLVMVGYNLEGARGWVGKIVDNHGMTIRNLDIRGSRIISSVARQGQVLFIADKELSLHVIKENNQYLKYMYTGLPRMRAIAVWGNNLWVASERRGVYKLTIDSSYNVVSKSKLRFDPCSFVNTMTVSSSRVALICWDTKLLYVFDHDGNQTFAPVGGWGVEVTKFDNPSDLVIDEAGRAYVSEYGDNSVLLFSENGEFLRKLVTKSDGLSSSPDSIFPTACANLLCN
jgi:hypothetical protein